MPKAYMRWIVRSMVKNNQQMWSESSDEYMEKDKNRIKQKIIKEVHFD